MSQAEPLKRGFALYSCRNIMSPHFICPIFPNYMFVFQNQSVGKTEKKSEVTDEWRHGSLEDRIVHALVKVGCVKC